MVIVLMRIVLIKVKIHILNSIPTKYNYILGHREYKRIHVLGFMTATYGIF